MSTGAREAAIALQGVGKCFQLSTVNAREGFLETLARLTTGRSAHKPLWALRGLSLEIGQGEILGLIGPNGAGKSTLLLLLADVLSPTEGSLTVRGRTSLFFQLATGLQPKLTVLDNFSVCAALLGMPRPQFQRLLPDLIAFSGLGDYLHAQFGELSTGLAARLAFATAIHTDLDIILADEMLTVGDEAFQGKCIRAFKEFQAQGKTMVLASHSMEMIRGLCSRALYLNAGRPAFLGPAEDAVARFHEDMRLGGSNN
ncbi:MAG: hypothetical protein A2X36_04235 [Elusimicrobia bacterium GWA2_69_24]|nr:MAG: hypothetical protein A2X36_04235 [Elusimicrobia bacterium GWA2_69_24]HBL16144.1 hypothetical protein [Elusimicrobiota bacterium]